VSIYYDPLISKLAAWGRTREESIDRLRRALDEYEVGGIKTTLPFFREIVRDEEFKSGLLDTAFISRFNQRRAAAEDENGLEQTRQDIAVIAAAILRATLQRAANFNSRSPEGQNRWKMSARAALHEARNLAGVRDKKA
jgi:acetyl-CoA carboxylase biotin carboxylase subunit